MTREQRRRAILREIASLGPVLPGSLTARTTRCQTEGCHCHAEPPVLHGPYLAWTHRAQGRQVTRALSDDQADALRPLLDANRRLHELVRELEELAAADAEQLLDLTAPAGKR